MMPHVLYDKTFRFNLAELNKLVAFRSVELDTGDILSGEASKFDKIYQTEPAAKGKVKFMTTGKVIDERVKKRK